MLWAPFFLVPQATSGKKDPIDVVRSNSRPGSRGEEQYSMNEWTILFMRAFNGKEYTYPVNTTIRLLESC